MKKKILDLIQRARVLGLEEFSINVASDYVEYNEYGLAFDTLLTQLYEYEIEIDWSFYNLVLEVAKEMKLQKDEFFFVKDLLV